MREALRTIREASRSFRERQRFLQTNFRYQNHFYVLTRYLIPQSFYLFFFPVLFLQHNTFPDNKKHDFGSTNHVFLQKM